MEGYKNRELVITGIGVTTAIGQGRAAFVEALLNGAHHFDVMKRPGRQKDTAFLGAEIGTVMYPNSICLQAMGRLSFTAQVAVTTLDEAWSDAELSDFDPKRVGLVIGGSNFRQRELVGIYDTYQDRIKYLNPTYGLSVWDTDLCAVCTEQFGIRGLACTLGGASASGQLALIHACYVLQASDLDVCVVLGALTDISYWECQALRSLGAMGSDRYANDAALACRPFDENRDGFIFGENCGVLIIEKLKTAEQRGVQPYAVICGAATVVDAHRNPDPSYEGEVEVITNALSASGLSPRDIDYVNPHGTGSIIGDEIELKALRTCRLSHAFINATKSLVGHGLHAAGTVELIATLLQMEAERLHPTRNLEAPIISDFNWIKQQAVSHRIRNALKLSMGFGGINTAVCLQNLST